MLPCSKKRIGSIDTGLMRWLAILLMALCVPRAADAQVLYHAYRQRDRHHRRRRRGCHVQALNVGTNVAKTATTDERGVYLFSDPHKSC